MQDQITVEERLEFLIPKTNVYKLYIKNRKKILRKYEKNYVPLNGRHIHLDALRETLGGAV